MKAVSIVSVLVVLMCGSASATVLTFYAGEGVSYELSQDYGDNVTSTIMGIFEYGENGEGFTPNVTVEYLGVGGDGLDYWRDDFSGTTGALLNEDDGEAFTTFKLVADDEHQVVLHSLLWSSWSGTSVPVTSITVTDQDDTVRYNSGSFNTLGLHDTIDFGAITGKTLTVTADLSSAGDDNDAFGFDDVTISQAWDTTVTGWTAPADSGMSIVRLQGAYPASTEEVLVKYNGATLYSSTNSLSFDFEQTVEPGDELLFLGMTGSGSLVQAESLSVSPIKESLGLATLDDFDRTYASGAWEAVPGDTWSGLKLVQDSSTNNVMTGSDFMYYRKASYRDLPFSITTNTHMSIRYFSKLGPKIKSDSSGISGITLGNHSFTNDGARLFEFRMGAHAPTSDDPYLLIYDGEGTAVDSPAIAPDINTWAEFRLDFDMSYVGSDGKYGLCSAFMKTEGATRWLPVAGLTQVEMKIDDPASVTKIGGIGHCSWSSYWGYYGFQPFLDDIRYCAGENSNLGVGENLLLDNEFNETESRWRTDGEGRSHVPSMHTNNEPFHNGVYLTCPSAYTAEVYQVVNLLNEGLLAEDIDAGIYNVAFGGWQYGGNGAFGQIELEFLDVNSQPISTNSLPVVSNTYSSWIEQMATNPVPAATRSIRYSATLGAYARADAVQLTILGMPQEDVTLSVASVQGSPSPSVGITSNSWGTVVTCSVQNVTADGIQYECFGWTGTGSVPTLGNTNAVEVTLTENSSIVWNWQTNVWLETVVSGGGQVTGGDAWIALGSNVMLTATPDAGWLFMGWSGDASGTNDASVTMDSPKAVIATFSDDADGDGLTNTEEDGYGSNPWNSDSDGDGFDDLFESQQSMPLTVNNSAIATYIQNNDDTFRLYSSNAVLDVAVGQALFNVSGSTATLNLQLEASDNLVTWTNAGEAVEWNLNVDGDKKYFRVRSGE